MSGRISGAMERALFMIGTRREGGGVHTAYSAAKECEVSLSGIYKALSRLKGKGKRNAKT